MSHNWIKRYRQRWFIYRWQNWEQPRWEARGPGWALLRLIALPFAVVIIGIRATL